jgi:hypothetical protein
MNPRVKALQELVRDGRYVVDAAAVAEAMMQRSLALRMLRDVTFHSMSLGTPQVRSFRLHPEARSFRLSRAERRPLQSAQR